MQPFCVALHCFDVEMVLESLSKILLQSTVVGKVWDMGKASGQSKGVSRSLTLCEASRTETEFLFIEHCSLLGFVVVDEPQMKALFGVCTHGICLAAIMLLV
jgi:hypothetical protein